MQAISAFPSMDTHRIDTNNRKLLLIDLPPELLLRLLLFVSDYDLQQLKRTCRQLFALSTDRVLWHYIWTVQNASKLSISFSKTSRPSRMNLISRNILKSTASPNNLEQQIRRGNYVNGPAAVQSFHASQAIERIITLHSLERRLRSRPSAADLLARHPLLHTKIQKLQNAMTRDRISHQLKDRKSFTEINKNVTKIYVTTLPVPNFSFLRMQYTLENFLIGKKLNGKLIERSDVNVLEQLKVLRTSAETAMMQCPSIKAKIQYFEKLR